MLASPINIYQTLKLCNYKIKTVPHANTLIQKVIN